MPVCVTLPLTVPVAPEEKVVRPVLVRARGPPPVVVKGALKVNAVPVSEIPEAPVVLSAPLNVVVPVPADCKIEEEKIAWVETLVAFVMVNPVSGVPTVPTFPPRVVFPVPLLRVKLKAPWTVWLRVISPAPVPVLSETLPPKVMGLANEIFAFAVVIDPARETLPVPFWVKAPAKLIAPAAVLVNVPLFVIVKGPPPVVVIAPPRTTAPEVMEIPKAPVVVRAPLNVVVPVPAVCTIAAAWIPCAVKLFALLTVRVVTGVLNPTLPPSVIEPVPAIRVKLWAPLTVELKVIFPFPELVSIVASVTRVTAGLIKTLPVTVRPLPANAGPVPIML